MQHEDFFYGEWGDLSVRRCSKGVDPVLDCYPKLIAINEEPDDEIVHGRRLGKAYCATDAPFHPGPQVDGLACDLLRLGFANRVLLRIAVSLVGPPPIRVKPCDPTRLEHRFALQKDGILPLPKAIRQHRPTGVIDGRPPPPWLRFLPDIAPHCIEF
jgi:hypothetical protein